MQNKNNKTTRNKKNIHSTFYYPKVYQSQHKKIEAVVNLFYYTIFFVSNFTAVFWFAVYLKPKKNFGKINSNKKTVNSESETKVFLGVIKNNY